MECPLVSVSAAQTTMTVAGLVSMGASTVLLVRSRQDGRAQSVLGRLVTLLAVADLWCTLWLFVPNWLRNGSFTLNPCVEWCGVWLGGVRLLQVWSVVLSAAMTLAVLLVLMKKPVAVEALRCAGVATLPVAALLNIFYFIQPATLDTSGPDYYCDSPTISKTFFEGTLCCSFLFVVVAFLRGILQVRRDDPGAVTRRFFPAVSSYMLAFILSWGPYVLTRILLSLGVLEENSCPHWYAQHVRDVCYVMNGVFNGLAFELTVWNLQARQVVTFGATETRSFQVQREEVPWHILLQPGRPGGTFLQDWTEMGDRCLEGDEGSCPSSAASSFDEGAR